MQGHLTIAGPAPRVISAGQALDALLADPRFSSWLQRQRDSECETANLFLANNQNGGIIPSGPIWDIELFCETGVPRHFSIAAVDAASGAVRLVNVCDDPCAR